MPAWCAPLTRGPTSDKQKVKLEMRMVGTKDVFSFSWNRGARKTKSIVTVMLVKRAVQTHGPLPLSSNRVQ